MKKYTFRVSLIFLLILILTLIFSFFIYSLILETKLTSLILLYYGLIVLTFISFTFIFYLILKKKNNDIEMSKNMYYYSKPYMIKVRKNGAITDYNRTCELNIKDMNSYKTIFDLDYSKKNYDILESIHRQKSFTIPFQSAQGTNEFIHFLPLKSKIGFYLIGENFTSTFKEYEYHRNLALYDKITRFPNGNYLGFRLQELFEDKDLLKKKNSLVAVNIQTFKNINKLFGKKIGNETLIELGKIALKTLTGYNATLFNDGEEFMVLFTELNEYKEVLEWTYKFIKVLEKPLEVQKNLFLVEVKMGIFDIDIDRYPNLNPNASIENAKLALKKSKESRRLTSVVYDIGLGQLFTHEQAMEADLLSAVKNQELIMFYQPQVNNITKKIVGFEALIRWNNPKYILESPARFIEMAEQNNLIVDIGRFIFNETFKVAKELESYDIRITINISPVQILQSGFVHEIKNVFDRYQLKKNSICLEITENFLMEQYDIVIDKLKLLRNHGFSIHLDNFGSGYSSMLYLKDLPIDGISITKEFIKNINIDKYNRAIVSKIIALAQSLELEISAEGVEDSKQNDFLSEYGCHVIQGYLISKPLPKSEAIQFMLENNVNKTKDRY